MEICPAVEPHKRSLAAEVLRSTGKVRLVARGHSMLPALWPGDLLNIEATSFDRVRAGDTVLFARDDRFLIHRVLDKHEVRHGSTRPSLVTRGDSMPQVDAPVFGEELLGRVVSFERHGHGPAAVPKCSRLRRCLGLLLGSGDRFRSLALRVHGWRSRSAAGNAQLTQTEIGSS